MKSLAQSWRRHCSTYVDSVGVIEYKESGLFKKLALESCGNWIFYTGVIFLYGNYIDGGRILYVYVNLVCLCQFGIICEGLNNEK